MKSVLWVAALMMAGKVQATVLVASGRVLSSHEPDVPSKIPQPTKYFSSRNSFNLVRSHSLKMQCQDNIKMDCLWVCSKMHHQ